MPLAQVIAPGFDPAKQMEVAQFTRVMLFSQLFLALSMIFGSMLQSLKRFFLYALAPIFYNVGIIIGSLVLVPWFGSIGLAYGVVLGAFFHAVIQWFGVHEAGYRYQFLFEPRHTDMQTMIRLTGPRVIGIGMNQLLFLILMMVATTLAVGSVTIFQFAYNIEFFPIGIFGVSYAIAAFPTFAGHILAHDFNAFRASFASTIRQILFFLLPISIMFLLLRAQLIRVVVGAGAFDWTATILAADTLAFFALAFIPQACVFILARAFFATHDTATPVTAGIVSAVIGIISAFLFTRTFGVVGLAMAFGLSETIHAGLLWMFLRQKIGSLQEGTILAGLSQMIPAALCAGVVMYGVRGLVVKVIELDSFFHVFVQLTLTSVIGLCVYALLLHVMKSDELRSVLASISRRQLKETKPQEAIASTDGDGTV
jgi:putative peptidoglycan lipid II flippase